MRYRVSHATSFSYEGPVSQCATETHLIPRELPGRQRVYSAAIEVDPQAVSIESRIDYFGNHVSLLAVQERHSQLTVTATSDVEVLTPPHAAKLPAVSWQEVRRMLREQSGEDAFAAYEFTFDSPYVAASPQLADYGAATFTTDAPLGAAAIEMMRRIYREFQYKPKSTTIDMPLAEILKRRRGVCQDFAHILIGVLRSHGLAARYVSGYLRSGGDFTGAEASHAWASVWLPEAGWLDLDPTNDILPGEGHVTVAWGRDYGDVTPVKGVSLGGGAQTVDVAVRVTPVAP